MTNLHTSSNHMQQAWRGLRECWETTRDSWKDVDRDRFEREHIRQFEGTVGKYVTRLNAVADMIARARSEVP